MNEYTHYVKKIIPSSLLPYARSGWMLLKVAGVVVRSPCNLVYIKPYRRLLHLNSTQDRKPWVTFGAIDWLSKRVNQNWHVFEFGSGGSTLFFIDRNVKLVSVEHDLCWFKDVCSLLDKEGHLNRLDYRFVPSENCEFGVPVASSSRFSAPNADYKKYVETIKEFPDETFDLVFIDGRARVECARHSLKKVRSGGFLLLDDSYRNDYKEIYQMLKDWKRRDFYGFGPYRCEASQTTIWESPKI
jgi:hypothetical protein